MTAPALGEFFYTAAELHVTKGAIAFTEYNRRFFEIAVEMSSFGRHAIGYEVAGYTDAKLLSAIVPGSVVTAKGNADTFKALMHALTLTGTTCACFSSRLFFSRLCLC